MDNPTYRLNDVLTKEASLAEIYETVHLDRRGRIIGEATFGNTGNNGKTGNRGSGESWGFWRSLAETLKCSCDSHCRDHEPSCGCEGHSCTCDSDTYCH